MISDGKKLQDRIGFRLSGFKNEELDPVLSFLAQCGYGAVELGLEHRQLQPDRADFIGVKRLKELLLKCGLTASAVSFHGKRADWALKRYYCEKGIILASELGINVFITGSSIIRTEENFLRMRTFCRDLCRYARQYEVMFAVEPEPDTLIHNSAMARRLIAEIPEEELKINLDIGHSYLTEADLLQDIYQWGRHIVHTHIEDIKMPVHRHLLPGAGEIDFLSVFRAFDDIGYHGYYIIDLFDFADKSKEAAQEAINRLLRKTQNV